MTERVVFFHEDDYCQIEILPAQNRAHCLRQIGEIEAFSEQHQAPDGAGWTGMMIRADEPSPLLAMGLAKDAVSAAITPYLAPFERVETGWSSHREVCAQTMGFGFHEDCTVFLSHNKAGTVEHIWLGLGGPDAVQQSALLSALQDLARMGDLLLIDWGWGELFQLNQCDAIAAYLIKREQLLA